MLVNLWVVVDDEGRKTMRLLTFKEQSSESRAGGAAIRAAGSLGPGLRGAVRDRAFTLIEIMVAVGIVAVFMTIAIPSLYHGMHEDSMRKAMSDVMEACSTARARAILDGTTMDLCIRPADRTLSVGASAPPPASEGGLEAREEYKFGERMRSHPARSTAPTGFTVKLGPSIRIEGLGVNGDDWTEDEEARVHFYANGTCDEMSIVLRSDRGEWRNIFLEVVTGMADYEVDPNKWRAR
jgi:prepilin-type N-terminal cleavage/methylation domain-containing protein